MLTSDIHQLMSHFHNGYQGTFPFDRIPKNLGHFEFVIANLSPADQFHGHWFALGILDSLRLPGWERGTGIRGMENAA